MKVQGCDCSIVIKTRYKEIDVPYSEETIRDAYSLLQEEASIEGDGSCRALRKKNGVTGCVVTPLSIGTVPLLLYLAMGSAGNPVFVSETRNVHKTKINLLPLPDTACFDLIQDRQMSKRTYGTEQLAMSNERLLYEGCQVNGFELRIEREQAIKLRLDVRGDRAAIVYPHTDTFTPEKGERYNGDNVVYKINGKEYKNIYGLTLSCKKEFGTRTELWIRRSLEKNNEIPHLIDEMTITSELLRDSYECRSYGKFTIMLTRLVLTADETSITSTGAVISPLRYYVAGVVSADVFSSTEEL
jgi:hypothetical protein